MKTYVINLKKDEDRRNHIAGQCRGVNLDFEFIEGVYGRALTSEELRRVYSPKKAQRTQCRELVLSEIGCALSHIAVYRRIIEEGIPFALVLEDDVVLPACLPSILSSLERLSWLETPAVILLSPGLGDSKKNVALLPGYTVAPYRQGFFTHAYVVTMAGARALLKDLFPVGDVADCWRRLSRHKVVDCYVVDPAVILQDQERFGGSTGTELSVRFPKRKGVKKIVFKGRRAFWLLLDLGVGVYDRLINPYKGTQKS